MAQELSEFRDTRPLISPTKGMGAQYLPKFKGTSPPLSPTMGIEGEGAQDFP